MADPSMDTLDPNSGIAQALMRSPNYINPAYATPEQVAFLRAQATELTKPGQIHNWAEGLGSLAQTAAGMYLSNKANRLQQQAIANAGRVPQSEGGAPASALSDSSGGMLGASPPSAGAASVNPDAASMVSAYAPQLGQAGAAGLVGGFGAESSFRPGAVGDNGASIGYGQWQGSRRRDLEAYALKQGASPSDPNIQKQFPLVEMGLAGSPNDPGFGTERRAGQALMAAKSPQEATAAALMYERPGGYTRGHPENANGYDRRLALASALMGKVAAPQMAGNGPMAYAPQSGPQGGAGVPWPAQRPQMPTGAGGQPQAAPGSAMAQNSPPPQLGQAGGGPMGGMTASQIMQIQANPWIPDHTKRILLEGNVPQVVPTPGGGSAMQPSLQPVRPTTVSPGVLSTPFGGTQEYAPASGAGGAAKTLIPGGFASTLGVGGQSIPAVTTMGPGGQPSTHLVMPGGEAGAGGGRNPLAPVMPLVHAGQGIQMTGRENEDLVHQIGALREAGPASKAALGQVATLESMGDKVGSGALPMIQSWAAQHGVQLGKGADVGDIQAYEAMANSMVPSLRPPGSGSLGPDIGMFKSAIGNLATTPEGRHIIANNLRMLHQYNAQVSDAASDFTKTPQDRWAEIQKLPVPKPVTTLPEKGKSQGAPKTAPAQEAAASGPPAGIPSDAKKARDGNWYSPDPSRPGKFLKWQ